MFFSQLQNPFIDYKGATVCSVLRTQQEQSKCESLSLYTLFIENLPVAVHFVQRFIFVTSAGSALINQSFDHFLRCFL